MNVRKLKTPKIIYMLKCADFLAKNCKDATISACSAAGRLPKPGRKIPAISLITFPLVPDDTAAFWEDKRNISAIHNTSAAAVIILNAALFALIIARLPKT